MYLKHITITGFKSFAARTSIALEPGITAIVGPNGSGKSNVADAIRWAMGEQSKTKLRLSEREEVIFAGSSKRAKGSLAEVTLLFDNTSGAFPLEAAEVEIARRMYRSGETEYRLMGRNVRLADIQLILAQARIGASSYAVVGQGVIDQMLLSSPSERKLLFEEASGIRADELKRETAVKRLARTEVNIVRLQDIVRELEPQLASYDRIMRTKARLEHLATEVATERSRFVCTLESETVQARAQLVEATTIRDRQQQLLTAEASQLTAERKEIQAAVIAEGKERSQRVKELEHYENMRDELMDRRSQATATARLIDEVQLQSTATTDTLKQLKSRMQQSERMRKTSLRELENLRAAVSRSEAELERLSTPVKDAQSVLIALRRQTDDGTQQQYITHALNIVKVVAHSLTEDDPSMDQVKLLVHKAGRLLSEGDMLAQLESAQSQLEAAMIKRERVIEHVTNVTISIRGQELEVASLEDTIDTISQQIAAHEETLKKISERRAEVLTAIKTADQLSKEVELASHAVGKARALVHDLSGSGRVGSREAELAVALERNTLAINRIKAETTAAKQLEVTLAATEARCTALRHEWNVNDRSITKSTADTSREPSGDIERRLDVMTARLEAERSAQSESESEFTAVKARSDEMTAQLSDLTLAQSDLGEVIRRLDEAIKISFNASFSAISEHFSRHFEHLFEGGRAELKLQTTEDGSYGIDIQASAKGKRLSSLSAMSGGERSLTGIALLAAIVSASESPFIVLDEVDAALDDTNAGRLARILESISTRSQLIVVTHNRQTMAAASVLYGVTLNEHHVSHVLSLHLEAATALASR
jgi:chromosome segregation ATPase